MRNSGKEAGMETDGQFLRDSTCTATFRNRYINFYKLFTIRSKHFAVVHFFSAFANGSHNAFSAHLD